MNCKYLIVNADDFALDENINAGIIQAYQSGIVTSTSILANGLAFASGIDLLQNNLELGVGVHLTLVDGTPLGDWKTIVDQDGKFYPDYQSFLKKYLSGRVNLKEIKEEWKLQIKKVRESGLPITHLDSHQHLHVVPGILRVVLELAEEFSIHSVRCPKEPWNQIAGGIPSLSRLLARNSLSLLSSYAEFFLRKNLVTTDNFLGMLWGGRMSEKKLMTILYNMPLSGVTELMVHPGIDDEYLQKKTKWGYHWEEEKNALISADVIDLLKRMNVSLINYKDL